MKRMLSYFLLWSLLVPAVSATAEELDGGTVYANNCGRCHNSPAPVERSDREWEVVIGHMRTVAQLTGKESEAVLRFLQSQNNPPHEEGSASSGTLSANSAPSGEALVQQGQCRACHVIGDAGGSIAPSLNGVLKRRAREYVMAHIENPKSHNPSSIMPAGKYSQAELTSLMEYLAKH